MPPRAVSDTLAERLDQFDLAGQMIRVIRSDAMEFIQQFLVDDLGLDVFHAMHHPVPHSPNRIEIVLLFEPIDQEIRRRFVIGGGEVAALPMIAGRVLETQICPGQADAVNRAIKPSLQWFSDLVKRELDARRTPIDCQYGCASWFHEKLLRYSSI